MVAIYRLYVGAHFSFTVSSINNEILSNPDKWKNFKTKIRYVENREKPWNIICRISYCESKSIEFSIYHKYFVPFVVFAGVDSLVIIITTAKRLY